MRWCTLIVYKQLNFSICHLTLDNDNFPCFVCFNDSSCISKTYFHIFMFFVVFFFFFDRYKNMWYSAWWVRNQTKNRDREILQPKVCYCILNTLFLFLFSFFRSFIYIIGFLADINYFDTFWRHIFYIISSEMLNCTTK